MVTPEARAALKLARFRWMPRGSGCSPFFQPAYCAVASPAASVGQRATWRSAISLKISGVPSSPCSMVSAPPRMARRMPSGVLEWTDTGTPALLAVSTASVISSSEKVGRAPGPLGEPPSHFGVRDVRGGAHGVGGDQELGEQAHPEVPGRDRGQHRALGLIQRPVATGGDVVF